MSQLILSNTQNAISQSGRLICENRSLFFDRYADPGSEKDTRKKWFDAGGKISVPKEAFTRNSQSFFPGATLLNARLMSRLMVNMAGGVMENAGLMLDRYGVPYIPGSAVKGCARRMALQALHDWSSSGSADPASDDIGSPCRMNFSSPAEMLAAIALVFGWVEQDWRFNSDFAWACGESYEGVWSETCVILFATFSQKPPENTPWKKLPNFAGNVAFLPARPNGDPGIELDVLTPHHTKYYESKDPNAIATDTEDPVPVYFPAVKAQRDGEYFTFPLLPLRRSTPDRLKHAKTWLAHGLAIFGLGAKTNAGYGWFDSSEEYSSRIAERIRLLKQAEIEERQRQTERAAQKAEEEQRILRKRGLEQALAGLSPEEQEDKKVELLSEAQFETKIRAFLKDRKKGGPTEEERQAIVRSLRGPRLAYWIDFNRRATKGELATIDQAIRALSKTMNLGKMP